MGLTAHNRKRRELAEKGQGDEITKAQAHYDAAERKLADLVDRTAVAEEHLEEMAEALAAAKAEALPPELGEMNHKALQALAKELNLSAGGNKADLVARIEAAQADTETEGE